MEYRRKKLIHLTEEPYVYKTMKVEDKLVSLKRVAYWGHPLSYDLDEIKFGIVDISKTSTNVKENIPFKPKKGKLTIDYNGKTLIYDVGDS